MFLGVLYDVLGAEKGKILNENVRLDFQASTGCCCWSLKNLGMTPGRFWFQRRYFVFFNCPMSLSCPLLFVFYVIC